MDQATQPLNAATNRLADDFRTVVSDAEQLLRQAVGQAGEGYADARQRLEASLATAREELSALEQSVSDSARRAGRATEGYVRNHPWESIAVGAGIGVLVGLLIGRK
jgi:ElaB/YqjD/DUF883 family membrane-anchored ribosome-binding protein